MGYVAVIGALLFTASPVLGQVLRGTVRDSVSGKPVEGAHVVVLAGDGPAVGDAMTGNDGEFTFRLPAVGDYRLRVSRLGYTTRVTDPISVVATFNTSVELPLTSSPVPSDTLTVVGLPVAVERQHPFLVEAGFYARRSKRIGHFLTRADLDRRRSERMTDALRGLSGVRVVCSAGTCDVQAPGAASMLTRGVCKPTVVLDGAVLRAGGVRSDEEQTVDQLLDPFNIEAVEVYTTSAGVPAQFRGSQSPCGAIIAWSRR
jgi:hypothetical protein